MTLLTEPTSRAACILRLWGVAAALLAGSVSARASIVGPTDVESLSRSADLVVQGVALETRAVRSEDGKQIRSITTLRIDQAIKGVAPGTVEVITPGGSVGNLTQRVSGAPELRAGEHVILFLSRLSQRRFSVKNLALGKFEVVTDAQGAPFVLQRAEGIGVLDEEGSLRAAHAFGPVPLDRFLERVRKAAERGQGGP